MSPRAAWRLERLGFSEVYDYVAGKVDWMATGLPTVRAEPTSRVIDAVSNDFPTCRQDDDAEAVLQQLRSSGSSYAVVVNNERIILGKVRLKALEEADGPVEEVMEPGPATVRAHDDLQSTLDRIRRRKVSELLVSTPDGRLIGAIVASS